MCIYQTKFQIYEATIDRVKRIGKSAIILGDFNVFLSATDKTRQKISKDTEDLNTVNHHNLTDTYRTLYPTKAEHTIFKAPTAHLPRHGLFWLITQITTNLNGLKS